MANDVRVLAEHVKNLENDVLELRRELRVARDEARERAFRSARHALTRGSPEQVSASFPGMSTAQLEAAVVQLERWNLTVGMRAPGGSASLHPLVRAAVRLAQAGVLDRYDLVDELATAYAALPREQQQEPELKQAIGAIGQEGLLNEVVEALARLRQEAIMSRGVQPVPPASSLKRPRPVVEGAAEPQSPPPAHKLRSSEELMEGILRAERDLARLSRQISGSPITPVQADVTPLRRSQERTSSVGSVSGGGAASQSGAPRAGPTPTTTGSSTSTSTSTSTGAPVESNVVNMSFLQEPWPANSRFRKQPQRATTMIVSGRGKAALILAQVVQEDNDFRSAFQQVEPGSFKAFVTATSDGRILAISTGNTAAAFTTYRLESQLRAKGLQVRGSIQLLQLPLCRVHCKPCKLFRATQGPSAGRSFYTCAEPPAPGGKSSECTFLWSDGFEFADKDWRERSGLAALEPAQPPSQSQPEQSSHFSSPSRTQEYASARATPQAAATGSPDHQLVVVMSRSAADLVADRAAAAAASNAVIDVD
jgi:hypothetical protein